MNGFSRAKVAFDKACGVKDWTLHDLRRCARSLLARCDVRPDIAEVTLGHVVAGIEGRYNVHKYDNEKAVALAKLAALVDASSIRIRATTCCRCKHRGGKSHDNFPAASVAAGAHLCASMAEGMKAICDLWRCRFASEAGESFLRATSNGRHCQARLACCG